MDDLKEGNGSLVCISENQVVNGVWCKDSLVAKLSVNTLTEDDINVYLKLMK